MDHNMVLGYNSGGEQMYLLHGLFGSPCGRIETIWGASPNAAWPGRHLSQWWHVKCTHFAGCFDGCGSAKVCYRGDRPMEKVHGLPESH